MALVVLHQQRAGGPTTPAVFAALQKMAAAHPRGGNRLWLVTDHADLLAERNPGGQLARVDVIDASEGWSEAVERTLAEALATISDPGAPAVDAATESLGPGHDDEERVVVTWAHRLQGAVASNHFEPAVPDGGLVSILTAAGERYVRSAATVGVFSQVLGERVRLLPWYWVDMPPADRWPDTLFPMVGSLGTRVRPFLTVPAGPSGELRRFDASSGGAPWGEEQLKSFLIGLRALAWHGQVDRALGEVDNALHAQDTSEHTFFVPRAARVELRGWFEEEQRLLDCLTGARAINGAPGPMPTRETLQLTRDNRPVAGNDREAELQRTSRVTDAWYTAAESAFNLEWRSRAAKDRERWSAALNTLEVDLKGVPSVQEATQRWRKVLSQAVNPAHGLVEDDAEIRLTDVLHPHTDVWSWQDFQDTSALHARRYQAEALAGRQNGKRQAEQHAILQGRSLAGTVRDCVRQSMKEILVSSDPDADLVSARVRVATAIDYLEVTVGTPLTTSEGEAELAEASGYWDEHPAAPGWFQDERAFRMLMRDRMPSAIGSALEAATVGALVLAFGIYLWFTVIALGASIAMAAIVGVLILGVRGLRRRNLWGEGRGILNEWLAGIGKDRQRLQQQANVWARGRAAALASASFERLRRIGAILEAQSSGLAAELERQRNYVRAELEAAERVARGHASGVWWTQPDTDERDAPPAGLAAFSRLITKSLASAAVPARYPQPVHLDEFAAHVDDWMLNQREPAMGEAVEATLTSARSSVESEMRLAELQLTGQAYHRDDARPVVVEAWHALWPTAHHGTRLDGERLVLVESSGTSTHPQRRFEGAMPPGTAVMLRIERCSMRKGARP